MKVDTSKTVAGYKLSEMEPAPIKEFAQICRKAAADGAVLLKNEDILPLKSGEKVAVFGRGQFDYYKSGTGSGGLVNVEYVTNIIDPLCDSGKVRVNEDLRAVYADWLKDNPFDVGQGWAAEPWCQEEMPLTEELCKNAARASDVAIIVISRTAGEDKDNKLETGSYLLTDVETDMLSKVTGAFEKVCVLLNVGNVIDMSFMDKFDIRGVMYVWHGGMEGGSAVCDLLTGAVSPGGKLVDTICYDVADIAANDNFGSESEVFYAEDIYVGYRYFETFCPEKVRFPFGFGLSYTTFDINVKSAKIFDSRYIIEAEVTNTGEFAGREVVQVYYSAPQGKLGKPAIELAAYKKTDIIKPGEKVDITIKFPIEIMGSFDDSGLSAPQNKNRWLMEFGTYKIYLGSSVRNVKQIDTYDIYENYVFTKKGVEAAAPVKEFKRLRPVLKDGKFVAEKEDVPTRKIDLEKRIIDNRPADIKYTGDKGYKLLDVAEGKCGMEQFIAQLAVEDMICMVKGEGMNSHKVTPGTGGAFGGVTNELLDFGIPVCCVTDGPSGVRLDSGAKSTAMPIGTALACTFDDELVEQMHVYMGLELRAYNVDALLGPGMNIHRHPLNGRNFEYFSEDPILTGKMAAAVCRGIGKAGSTATIKHLAANNQEIGRSSADSIISQRALREIYLKGFEIAVKESDVRSVMTAYNPLNGFWCAGNYDLNTTILREDWKFDGFVMTDWWAKMNVEGGEASNTNTKQMVRSQNDVFMVCQDSKTQPDNIREGLDTGYITVGDLQRCCKNLLSYIIKSPTFERYVLGGCVKPSYAAVSDADRTTLYTFTDMANNTEYDLNINQPGEYIFVYDYSIDADELAQFWVRILVNGKKADGMAVPGTNGKVIQIKQPVNLEQGNHKLYVEATEKFKMNKIEIKI